MAKIGCVTIILGFAALAVVAAIFTERPSRTQEEIESGASIYACKGAAKSLANDPTSVDFDDNSTFRIVPQGNGQTSIMMGMRAKNGFGALMHGRYMCKTKSDGATTKVISFERFD